MSVRERFHRRWWAWYPSDGAALVASFWTLAHWLWIDRYNDWSVARFGECGPEPWWLRPASRFVCWCADWRVTIALRVNRACPWPPNETSEQ